MKLYTHVPIYIYIHINIYIYIYMYVCICIWREPRAIIYATNCVDPFIRNLCQKGLQPKPDNELEKPTKP